MAGLCVFEDFGETDEAGGREGVAGFFKGETGFPLGFFELEGLEEFERQFCRRHVDDDVIDLFEFEITFLEEILDSGDEESLVALGTPNSGVSGEIFTLATPKIVQIFVVVAAGF